MQSMATTLAEIHQIRTTGNNYFTSEEYDIAIRNYELALQSALSALVNATTEEQNGLNAQILLLWHNTALAQIKMGRLKKALKIVDEALLLKKELFLIKDKITILTMMGRYKEAEDIAEQFKVQSFKIIKNLRAEEIERTAKMFVCTTELVPLFERIDVDFIIFVTNEFKEGRNLSPWLMCKILREAYAVFANTQNISFIDTEKNVFVFGDTHGQYFDVIEVVNKIGMKNDIKLIFNGDFVDRGKNSVENMIFLFLLKIAFPSKIFLNRGNHEFSEINSKYGFFEELKTKYPEIYDFIYDCFSSVFSLIPIAAVINRKMFIVHGGIPKDSILLKDIMKIDRMDRATIGCINYSYLMWADPFNGDEAEAAKRPKGMRWGPESTNKFLTQNNLDLIIRSHEFVETDGFRLDHDGKVITIFSCPDYCDGSNNAAYLKISKNEYEVVVFGTATKKSSFVF